MLKLRLVLLSVLSALSANIFVSFGQIPDVSSIYAPPAPGMGHDYIGGAGKMASDIVNPLTGSVTFRIDVPAPPTRGPSFAASLVYNSAGIVQYLGGPTNEIGIMRTDPGSGPGWTFSLPTLTFMTAIGTSDAAPYSCNYTTSYVFRDVSGAAHPLYLSVFNNGDDEHCHEVGVYETRSGGDGLVSSSITGSYLDSAGTVTVVDHAGTIYFFNQFQSSNASGPGGYYAFPSKITDRSGNITTITQSADGSFIVTDPNGRVSAQASARSGTQILTTTAWQGNATLVWTQASRGIPNLQSDASCGPNGGPFPNGSASGNVYLLQSLALPGNYTFHFEYDPTSGFLRKVTYPNGGFIHYTWGLSPRSESLDWAYPPSSLFCHLHRDFPAITKREVSFDGSTIAQTQTFSYSTQWSTSLTPNTKQTSVTTIDNARQSAGMNSPNVVTTYTYENADADIWNERTIITSQGQTSRTVTKAWYNGTLLCATELLDGAALSGTIYGYTHREVSDLKSYDVGVLSDSTFCKSPGYPYILDLTGLPSPTREVVTAYHGFANPNLLSFPDSVKIYGNGSSTPSTATTYSYDENALADVPNVAGHDSSIVSKGNTTTITQGSSTQRQWFDITGQIVQVRDGRGNDTFFSYADSTNGAVPSVPTNAYMTEARSPTTENGVAHVATFKYDYGSGAVISSTPETGNSAGVTGYTYADPLGRLTTITPPAGGGTRQFFYYDNGAYQTIGSAPYVSETSQIDASRTVTVSAFYDGIGNTIRSESPTAQGTVVVVEEEVDGLQRPMRVSNPIGGFGNDPAYSTYSYDALGRISTTVEPDGSSRSITYSGASATSCDEANQCKTATRDAFGQIVTVDEGASGSTVNYTYDPLGNLRTITQTSSKNGVQTRTFTYDSNSRIITSSNPETGTICYGQWNGTKCQGGYDENGNLLFKTDANNTTISYTYDALNRLRRKSDDDSTVADDYYYDTIQAGNLWGTPFACANGIGRLCLADHGGIGGTGFDYDSVGRVKDTLYASTISQPTYVQGYVASYDLAGNLTDLTYPDNRSVHQVYDGAGRLFSVTDSTGGVQGTAYFSAAQYSPAGALSGASFGNGVTESLTYNNRLQPCHLAATSSLLPANPSAGNLFDRQMFYSVISEANCGNATSNNGNIWHISDTPDGSQSQNFTYDGLNRLTSAYTTNRPAATAYNHTYNYDSFGSLLIQDNNAPAAFNNQWQRDPNGTNRLFRVVDSTGQSVYQYDAAGNLVSTGDAQYGGHIFNYNALGDVYAMDNGSTAKYYFNGSDERELKLLPGSVWTSYVYRNGQPMAERTSDSTWTDYIYANGQKVAKVSSAAPGSGVQVTVRFTNDSWSAGTGAPVGGGDRNLLINALTVNGTAVDLSQARYTSLTAPGCNGNGTLGCTGDLTITVAPGSTVAVTAWGTPDYSLGPDMQILVNGARVQDDPNLPQTPQTYTVSATATQAQPTVAYYLADQVGTTQMELDASGYPIWQGQFTPFGQELDSGSTAMHYKFTGKERDTESGLDYFSARYYASSMGRFMSPDPLGGHLENPQSLNKYAYALNNPLTNTDPTGLDSYLQCTVADDKSNASTCQSQTVGYDKNGKAQTATVQGVTGKNGFTATLIGNDANGNLVDKTTGTGSYTASVNGSGVNFSNNGGQTSSTGVFVNGTPQTTFQDAGFANGGALSGFNFTLTNSKMEANQAEAGTFSFNGTPEQAGAALMSAGFKNLPGANAGMDEYRSRGSYWTGADSGHFNVYQILLNPRGAIPQASGNMHFGEHNPDSPLGWGIHIPFEAPK